MHIVLQTTFTVCVYVDTHAGEREREREWDSNEMLSLDGLVTDTENNLPGHSLPEG